MTRWRSFMSDYRSEASSRSAVKTELTSAHLECSLISLASGLFVAAVWMQTIRVVLIAIKQCSPVCMSTPAQGGRSAHKLLYLAAVWDDWHEQEHRQGMIDTDPSLQVVCRCGHRWWSELIMMPIGDPADVNSAQSGQ